MRCPSCGHDNAASQAYCARCGQKTNLTADEIQASIRDTARGERAARTEENMKNLLGFAGFLLLLAVGFFVAVGTAPQGRAYAPSAAEHADFVRIDWRFEPKMERALVPFKVKGRNP